ncbi:unnamed protein product [Staurois parvus]|uniref:Uncharacterized protein n=1 Tax=Staurois parvus TaxID=386267 RepID=A0ABN9HWW5_9NEOB|nr:unnamed protein product [Staurois parvus]
MKPSIVYNCHVTCCDWSQQVTWHQQREPVLGSVIGRVREVPHSDHTGSQCHALPGSTHRQ